MNVTNIRVSFSRQVRPADYENANAHVEFAAVVDEGEDHSAVAAELLSLARRQALAAVGRAPKVEEKAEVSEPPKEEKPKAARKSRTKKAEPKEEEAQPPVNLNVFEELPPVALGSELTDKDLQDAANAAAKKHKGPTILALMQDDFGVARLGEIKQEDRPRFLEALRALDK